MDNFKKNPNFKIFRDHIFLRTFSLNHNRNHFPIVINTADSKFYTRDILEITGVHLSEVAIMDLNQYQKILFF